MVFGLQLSFSRVVGIFFSIFKLRHIQRKILITFKLFSILLVTDF